MRLYASLEVWQSNNQNWNLRFLTVALSLSYSLLSFFQNTGSIVCDKLKLELELEYMPSQLGKCTKLCVCVLHKLQDMFGLTVCLCPKQKLANDHLPQSDNMLVLRSQPLEERVLFNKSLQKKYFFVFHSIFIYPVALWMYLNEWMNE